jgi:hypothetical protein
MQLLADEIPSSGRLHESKILALCNVSFVSDWFVVVGSKHKPRDLCLVPSLYCPVTGAKHL